MHSLVKFTFKFRVIIFLLALVLVLPAPVQAQTKAWTGVCVSETDPDVATVQGLECLIANVFSVIISFIGLGGFVMMIVGSIRWLVSGGNTNQTEKARGTFTYAVAGIVLALSAYIILNLLSEFTGVWQLTKFYIPRSNEVYE
jgi:hypothetical protein